MMWIVLVVGALALVAGALVIVGHFVPREHRATCRARFRAGPGALFALLTDVEAFPAWRSGVKAVRVVDPIGGKLGWVEDTRHGAITYAVETSQPPSRLVLRIADESLPFGGTWTFALAEDGEGESAGTVLSITEEGFIRPAVFRTLSRFVFGYHATMTRYLEDVAAKVGEPVSVERVEPVPDADTSPHSSRR